MRPSSAFQECFQTSSPAVLMNLAAKSWQKSSVGINRTSCADKEDLKKLTEIA